MRTICEADGLCSYLSVRLLAGWCKITEPELVAQYGFTFGAGDGATENGAVMDERMKLSIFAARIA
jgi:hypothetical protein